MNESSYELRSGETHIEVHKFYPGAILVVSVLALVFQAMAPVYVRRLEILEVPLLVTIYFGLSRRNPSTGLLLGMLIGLAQDALSGPTVPLGFYGIAKTIIGFLASSIGARLDTEHPVARFALIFGFFVLHQAILVLIRRLLLAQPESWFNVHLAIAAAVNALFGTVLYLAFDRLRRRS
jgi:rod shape-determining protein MreD